MKKILFLCTDHFDLYKIFEKGIIAYSGCEVTTVIYNKFEYKNKIQKVQNFLSKLIFRENLKPYFSSQATIDSIPKNIIYDYVFVICPDLIHIKHLSYLKKISKRTIVYYWDGFDHFPKYKESVAFFDDCFSFDPIDVKKYGLKFITNFYFYEDHNTETNTDLFFLSSYDSRYPLVEKIVSILEKQNKKTIIYQHTNDKNLIQNNQSKSIIFIDKFISFSDTMQLMKQTKIILDIHKNIQHGLSFRVFEAIGLRKKLITTNPDIINYDFYNPNNIFLWKEDTTEIPSSFLNTNYQEIPEEIYQKYSQESWVNEIFSL